MDLSGSLLDAARAAEAAQPLGIGYVRSDVAAFRDPTGFAAVTCGFGLSDIDDLHGALAAVSGALAPGGRFAFSILHPCLAGGAEREPPRRRPVPGLPGGELRQNGLVQCHPAGPVRAGRHPVQWENRRPLLSPR